MKKNDLNLKATSYLADIREMGFKETYHEDEECTPPKKVLKQATFCSTEKKMGPVLCCSSEKRKLTFGSLVKVFSEKKPSRESESGWGRGPRRRSQTKISGWGRGERKYPVGDEEL